MIKSKQMRFKNNATKSNKTAARTRRGMENNQHRLWHRGERGGPPETQAVKHDQTMLR